MVFIGEPFVLNFLGFIVLLYLSFCVDKQSTYTQEYLCWIKKTIFTKTITLRKHLNVCVKIICKNTHQQLILFSDLQNKSLNLQYKRRTYCLSVRRYFKQSKGTSDINRCKNYSSGREQDNSLRVVFYKTRYTDLFFRSVDVQLLPRSVQRTDLLLSRKKQN